jgi:AraC-like DNA-binding protein
MKPDQHPCDQLAPNHQVLRHRHAMPYVAIVMKGNYCEAGDQGAFDLREGDVVFHSSFEAHANWIGKWGAQVMNITMPANACLPPAFRVRDPEALIQADMRASSDFMALIEPHDMIVPLKCDWEDQLASALRADPHMRLSAWAAENKICVETISRGFRRRFGTTAIGYRAATRARGAWRCVQDSKLPLAQIAPSFGYADQAHMTRGIVALTGVTPARWRRAG